MEQTSIDVAYWVHFALVYTTVVGGIIGFTLGYGAYKDHKGARNAPNSQVGSRA